MLTVLIETRNDEDALARTLGSLVSGAVEGVVRDVLIHDRGSTDQTLVVADHAGCSMVAEGELAAALKRARGEWLLFIEPGARLSDGWIAAVVEHASQNTSPARFRSSRKACPRFLSRLFSRGRPLADGLLVSKPQAVALLENGADLNDFARKVGARRIGAEITPPEPRSAGRG